MLLWVAQGKANSEVAVILGMSDKTARQHLGVCFQKMGVESRNAAAVVALETLSARCGCDNVKRERKVVLGFSPNTRLSG